MHIKLKLEKWGAYLIQHMSFPTLRPPHTLNLHKQTRKHTIPPLINNSHTHATNTFWDSQQAHHGHEPVHLGGDLWARGWDAEHRHEACQVGVVCAWIWIWIGVLNLGLEAGQDERGLSSELVCGWWACADKEGSLDEDGEVVNGELVKTIRPSWEWNSGIPIIPHMHP